jgi:hypothetical protein
MVRVSCNWLVGGSFAFVCWLSHPLSYGSEFVQNVVFGFGTKCQPGAIAPQQKLSVVKTSMFLVQIKFFFFYSLLIAMKNDY